MIVFWKRLISNTMETPYQKMMREQAFIDWICSEDFDGYKYPNSMLEEYDEEREKDLCFE